MFQAIINKIKSLTPAKKNLTASIRVKHPLYTAHEPKELSDFCRGSHAPDREIQVWINKDGFVIDAPFACGEYRPILMEDFPVTVYILDTFRPSNYTLADDPAIEDGQRFNGHIRKQGENKSTDIRTLRGLK